MKTVDVQRADMSDCIRNAKRHSVVITSKGRPLAIMVGVQGMDFEQLELSLSDKFWNLVRKWRQQKTMSRAELERRLAEHDRQKRKANHSSKKKGSQPRR